MQKLSSNGIGSDPEIIPDRNQISWRENVFISIFIFACYCLGGAYLDFYRGYMSYDALSRMVSAWLVTQGTVVKISSIGFIWPPIPTLMLIPWALNPSLFQNWMAVVIVSALSMTIACMMVGQIASVCSLSPWWCRAFVFLFAANPLIFLFAINGMSEAIMIAVTLIAFYWIIRYWQTGRNTHLIFSAGFFGLLPLIRYEMVILSAWSGVLIFLLAWEKRHQFTPEKFGQYLEGILLAFSSLVIYPLFLWIIANWFIMGNPFYFLFDNRSALNRADLQLIDWGVVTTPWNSFAIVLNAWGWTFPLELIGTVALIVVGLRKKINFLVGLGLMPLMIPALQFLLLVRRSNVPLLRYFVMVVPLGLFVTLVFLYVFRNSINQTKWGKFSVTMFCILLLALSNVLSFKQLNTFRYQTAEAAAWRALTGQGNGLEKWVQEPFDIGKLLVKQVPAGSKILIDTFGGGFAVMLGANTHKIFMDFTDPDYEAALLNPGGYADYILLPAPIGNNANYSVNLTQKSLYSDGATWAEVADFLPVTVDGWKLYKVNK